MPTFEDDTVRSNVHSGPAVIGTTANLPTGALGTVVGKCFLGSGPVEVPSATGALGAIDKPFGQTAGVYGESDQQGVFGLSTGDGGTGVFGTGDFGVRGETQDGIAAVKGQSFGTALAGQFMGNVEINGHCQHNGNIRCSGDLDHGGNITCAGDMFLPNRDISERFPVSPTASCEPGMVMVITEAGALQPCSQAYDRRVVGVIAGAAALRPAITLGHSPDSASDAAIAMVGTTSCLVDADQAPIEVGDLLTSAATMGYAMKAQDPLRGFGAVIGKALAPLQQGRGLISIVIALR